MAFNISEIRSQLQFGGARPSNFQVLITNPVDAAADLKTPFMVQSASIPPSNITNIPVKYFGRDYNVAGTRTFDPWTVTIINDEDFPIRNALERWSHSINTHESNLREFATASPLFYKSDAQVIHFAKTGVPLREYTFRGLYPTNVSEIALSWADGDTVETFTATFQYDYWEVTGGITGISTS